MTQSNGKNPKRQNHFLSSATDGELLTYIYDLTTEMESICEQRGFSDLRPLFAMVKDKINPPGPPM